MQPLPCYTYPFPDNSRESIGKSLGKQESHLTGVRWDYDNGVQTLGGLSGNLYTGVTFLNLDVPACL